jgi:hypothetical protein
VPAVWHVAVLALHALCCRATRLPLLVGVFEELAVQREAILFELMAAHAEMSSSCLLRVVQALEGQVLGMKIHSG